MPSVQHRRGTRTALDTLASAGGLLTGQLYVITDEQRLAVALSTTTYRAFPSASATTSARVLATPFRPSVTHPVWCSYTIEASVTVTVLAGESAEVELRSDAAATPTTVRGSVSVQASGVLGLTRTDRQQLVYLCPAGHYVSLVKSGAGIATLVSQVEVSL